MAHLQPLKHTGQIVEMLFRALSHNDDVIQVASHSCQAVSQLIHHPPEDCRGRGNPKWQTAVTVQPKMGVHRDQLRQLFIEQQLLVGLGQIKCGKQLTLARLTKCPLAWEWNAGQSLAQVSG